MLGLAIKHINSIPGKPQSQVPMYREWRETCAYWHKSFLLTRRERRCQETVSSRHGSSGFATPPISPNLGLTHKMVGVTTNYVDGSGTRGATQTISKLYIQSSHEES